MNKYKIGCDIEENKRFVNKSLEKDKDFLKSIFTPNELSYCFLKAHPAQHLCVRFCAKEAVIKALSASGIDNVDFTHIEVLNNENGVPYITIKNYEKISIPLQAVTLSQKV